MNRKTVNKSTLLAWLNKELRRNRDAVDCRFISADNLKVLDTDGCNWSVSDLECSGTGSPVLTAIAANVIADAKKRFNLE